MDLDVDQQMPENLDKNQVLCLTSGKQKHVYRIDL